MAVATWRVLAFGALLASVALPASAQVVIGGSGQPSVEVNWGVLDSLGRPPTLADMLKTQPPQAAAEVAPSRGKTAAASAGVKFQPYKPVPAKPAKAKSIGAKPAAKKTAIVPASAKAPASVAQSAAAQAVQAVHKADAVKAAAPAAAPAGPQVSLPEVPAPVAPPQAVAAATPAPVELPKAEPAKAEPAKVEVPKAEPAKVEPPKAEPVKVEAPKAAEPVSAPVAAALPATGLTPPPMPPVAVADPQTAALPAVPAPVPVAVSSSKGGDTLSVVFGSESASLPGSAQAELDQLAKRLHKDDGLGLQLLAFAEGDDASASKARRLSLSRALEVRKYLMEQGIRSTRIEVRALGNKVEGSGPADRVDAVLVSR